MLRLVDHLAAGRAMDYLAKSAAKIIKDRRMDSDNNIVSLILKMLSQMLIY